MTVHGEPGYNDKEYKVRLDILDTSLVFFLSNVTSDRKITTGSAWKSTYDRYCKKKKKLRFI